VAPVTTTGTLTVSLKAPSDVTRLLALMPFGALSLWATAVSAPKPARRTTRVSRTQDREIISSPPAVEDVDV
jgi:hypothetical protein